MKAIVDFFMGRLIVKRWEGLAALGAMILGTQIVNWFSASALAWAVFTIVFLVVLMVLLFRKKW